ncbi:asparagine synthase (glutamine-hydrolyzing) [Cenarchaeum symbiosum A]|uniref:Asparagine synthase (Glutamine-hydrolyzing) n=1 Tax=Cenarchaeum symbiosum (strain A) TaxID=414004 RepID=A0RWI1_CENSY|nr:asparagine synthase (glutamine-hydrolyzing) [Cenarchaeum symbiosum A]
MDLLAAIEDAIRQSVPAGRIGVAFSGGVDSALVGAVCKNMGYEVELLTVGFAGSQDLSFAAEAAPEDTPHHTLEIDQSGFDKVARSVEDTMGASPEDTLSWYENGIAFHYVAVLAHENDLHTVLTANGIDELFCGYDVYRREYGQGSPEDMIRGKVEHELKMMEAVGRVTAAQGVQLLQPLLSPKFVEAAGTIPIEQKIRGPDDMLRKHAIRDAARRIGVPEISAGRRKKALQYGSGIHKALIKSRRSRGLHARQSGAPRI